MQQASLESKTFELKRIIETLPLKCRTSKKWLDLVLADLGSFLVDHASCERKAHAAAMMLVNRFYDRGHLQDKMIDLAMEELEHFKRVVGLLRKRDLVLVQDQVDEYVKRLMTHCRHPRDEHLLDKLLVVAIVEARSAERFCMLAEALPDGELKEFYTDFAIDESRHMPLFLSIARHYFSSDVVDLRFEELLEKEALIVQEVTLRASVH